MQKASLKIDQKDLEIIKLYSKNPSISQEHISKKLGISQPTIALRVKKLKINGLLSFKVGIDIFKNGYQLAKIDLRTKNPNDILQKFQSCPYFLNGFQVSGKHNITLFFVGKNNSTLECIINNHLRTNPNIQDIVFNIVISSINKLILPLKYEKCSCGSPIRCEDCAAYKEKRCDGCSIFSDITN